VTNIVEPFGTVKVDQVHDGTAHAPALGKIGSADRSMAACFHIDAKPLESRNFEGKTRFGSRKQRLSGEQDDMLLGTAQGSERAMRRRSLGHTFASE
jgi:hypothetical protein